MYDVAVVGSRGFLGSAVAAELDRRGAAIGRFTKDNRYDGGARTAVWAAGHITPADTSLAAHALEDFGAFLDIAGSSDHPTHVVLLSSGGAVYGPPAVAPFHETDEPSPANEYGRVKLDEERLLAASGLEHTILRIGNPYGPAQVALARGPRGGQGVIGHWLAAVQDGRPITLFGDGSVVRDYLYIEDLAAAVATAAERRLPGVVNIGSGAGTSLAELLDLVHDAVAPLEVTVHREPARGIDPPAAWLDTTRARTELGWEPTVSLIEGLSRTWAAVAR